MSKKVEYNSAVDFLFTYGWAILTVLVAIGALAYFGVLNPKNFGVKSDSCIGDCGNFGKCSVDFVHNSTDSYNILKCCVGYEFDNDTKDCEFKYQYSYLKIDEVK
jgi:hypothetical protein